MFANSLAAAHLFPNLASFNYYQISYHSHQAPHFRSEPIDPQLHLPFSQNRHKVQIVIFFTNN